MLKKNRIVELFDAGMTLDDIASAVRSKFDYVDYVIKCERPLNKPRYVNASHNGVRFHIDWEKSLSRTDVIREYKR